jgi:hypothetical protein
MGSPIDGFPTMGRGIRVPSGDSDLDRILWVVQQHSDCLPVDEVPGRLWELPRRYETRDLQLYEAVERIRAEVADRWPDAFYADVLLEAIEEHAGTRLACSMLEELAARVRKRDEILYDQAASIRVEALAFSETAGVYFEDEMLQAVLDGRKTVMRLPVEFNRYGKYLPGYYDPFEVTGVAYALCGASTDETDSLRTIDGHRLTVTSVRMEDFGDITDEEARREGLSGRVQVLTSWWQRHGNFPFAWPVWRYEIALIDS